MFGYEIRCENAASYWQIVAADEPITARENALTNVLNEGCLVLTESLQRSGAQPSERLEYLGIMGTQLRTLRTSRHYGTEGFKESPQLSFHYSDRDGQRMYIFPRVTRSTFVYL